MTPKRTYRTKHPLYVIPEDYPALQEMFSNDDMMEVADLMANGDLHVYASEFSPETDVTDLVDPDYDDDGTRLSDFVPEYTPTSEEVMRALRGPQGNVGPMGPQGDQGESRKCECLELEDELAAVDIDPKVPPKWEPVPTDRPHWSDVTMPSRPVFGYWGRKP